MQFRELNIKHMQNYDEIVKELLNGLMTDGGHHKQHSIETTLRLICDDSWVDEAKQELGWDDGIPA